MKERKETEISFCFNLQQVQNLPLTQELFIYGKLGSITCAILDINSHSTNLLLVMNPV